MHHPDNSQRAFQDLLEKEWVLICLSELAVVNLYIRPQYTISIGNERTLVAGESHVFLICLFFYLNYNVYFFLTSLVDLKKRIDLVQLSQEATVIHMRLQSTINVENERTLVSIERNVFTFDYLLFCYYLSFSFYPLLI